MARPELLLKYGLWLLPALGVSELCAQLYFSQRFPRAEAWQALEPELARTKQASDLVVIAPRWAEPVARQAFGDTLMPLRDVARPDEAGYPRAIEIGARGETAPELAAWPVLSERSSGPFSIRVRKNPAFREPGFVFLDHAAPPELQVFEDRAGDVTTCSYRKNAPVTAGSLLGHPTFPRERFVCGGAPGDFVGLTVIDDQRYRARRCLWANPAPGGTLTLSFADVPLNREIRGYVGLPYFTYRDEGWPDVTLTVRAGDRELGRHAHRPARGWQPFSFSTHALRGQREVVEFMITGNEPRELQLCFYAEVR